MTSSNNQCFNFYELAAVKELANKYDNPMFGKNHYIQIPCRSLVIGSSGSMKTTTLLNIIKKMSKTFDHVILCCKSSSEPLYQWLIDKLKDNISVYENGEIPTIEEVQDAHEDEQVLAIFDDLINDKYANQQIVEYFIRSRKACKGISCFYLSQSYYQIPKIIRSNSNYLILKKLASLKDLSLILNENNMANVDIKKFRKLYKDCTSKKEDFMMISLDDGQIYHNFLKNITPKEEHI